MKYIFFIVALLFAVNTQAQVKSASLEASGLTCAMCSKAVYTALSKVPFVEKVDADIETSSYQISFKNGSKVDFDALSKAVVDAGFSVAKLKVTTQFKDAKVENDAHIVADNQSFHFMNVTPQTLNGTKTIRLVDKNFVLPKEYKKFGKLTTMKCYESGVMDGKRIYHATL